EVAELVNRHEDAEQQRERDEVTQEPGHDVRASRTRAPFPATMRSAASRAVAAASRTSARLRIGRTGTVASTSASNVVIAGKGIKCFRKASTATSSAATSEAGSVPPRR